MGKKTNKKGVSPTETKISLCMIVKDEEKDLRRCLESARGFVDEMVVVDTGSKDKTVDIAREFGARVFSLAWQKDFSLARNYALAQASFGWILILDADDELQLQGVNKQELLELGFDIFVCRIVNCIGSPLFQRETVHPQPRLFRKSSVQGYSGALHEQLVYDNNVKIALTQLQVIHYGYFDSDKDRGSRNVEILASLVKREPDNLFAHYNLATEWVRQGETVRAIKLFAQLYPQLDKMGTGLVTELIRAYGAALMGVEEYGKALEIIASARERFPRYTDLVAQEAKICYQQGDWTQARKLLQVCLEMGESPAYYCTAQGVGSRLPWLIMGEMCHRSGDYAKTVDCFIRALSYNQEDITPLLKMAVAASRKLAGEGIYEEIGKYCRIPHEYWKFVIQALVEFGEIKGARTLLDKVGHLGLGHDYYAAQVEFTSGVDYQHRLEKALAVARDSEESQVIASMLCVGRWLEQDWLGAETYLSRLQGSLARVYNSFHQVLIGQKVATPCREDFHLVLHLLRQGLCVNRFDLAQQAYSLLPAQLSPVQFIELLDNLIRFGAYSWAVKLLHNRVFGQTAEIKFIYGKALLGCGQTGPALTIFKNLAAEQPGFTPVYLGMAWANLARASELGGGPLALGRFEQLLDHWLRTGYLITTEC